MIASTLSYQKLKDKLELFWERKQPTFLLAEQIRDLTPHYFSILGTVVQVDKGIVEYREWVKANWHHLEKRLPHPENYDHDGYCSVPGNIVADVCGHFRSAPF